MYWGIIIDKYGASTCIHFGQITFSSKETDVLSLFTEEQDQLLCILYLDANWNRNGSSRYWYDLFLLLTDYKSIETYGT